MEFSVMTVSAFVVFLNELTKAIAKNVFGKDIKKFIPIFSVAYGLVLGLVAWFVKIPNFGNNVIEAAFIGLSSGAAATGYHQIGKQLMKKEEDDGVKSETEDGVEEVDTEYVDPPENIEYEEENIDVELPEEK